jgi:hypothetical protein
MVPIGAGKDHSINTKNKKSLPEVLSDKDFEILRG